MKKTAKEVISEGELSIYYWVNALCENCGFKKSLAFEKNIPIKQHSCPNCGCEKLIKY